MNKKIKITGIFVTAMFLTGTLLQAAPVENWNVYNTNDLQRQNCQTRQNMIKEGDILTIKHEAVGCQINSNTQETTSETMKVTITGLKEADTNLPDMVCLLSADANNYTAGEITTSLLRAGFDSANVYNALISAGFSENEAMGAMPTFTQPSMDVIRNIVLSPDESNYMDPVEIPVVTSEPIAQVDDLMLPRYWVVKTPSQYAKLWGMLYQLTQAENPIEFAKQHLIDFIIGDNNVLQVRVIIELKEGAELPEGITIESQYKNAVQALVNIDQLLELAALDNIDFIRIPFRAVLDGNRSPVDPDIRPIDMPVLTPDNKPQPPVDKITETVPAPDESNCMDPVEMPVLIPDNKPLPPMDDVNEIVSPPDGSNNIRPVEMPVLIPDNKPLPPINKGIDIVSPPDSSNNIRPVEMPVLIPDNKPLPPINKGIDIVSPPDSSNNIRPVEMPVLTPDNKPLPRTGPEDMDGNRAPIEESPVMPNPGDFNDDGYVGPGDLHLFQQHYLTKVGDDNWDPLYDLTGDGFVNIADFGLFAKSYQPTSNPGDFNDDGYVGPGDLHLFQQHYLTKVGDDNWDPLYDLTGDGFVNITDFGLFAKSYQPTSNPGDFNDDGNVGPEDFHLFQQHYLTKVGDDNWDPLYDLTGDGFVNIADFGLFDRYYQPSLLHPINQ
ncbi:MAG: dockerin type I domain-containing protein [Candidatus Omnitrophota bacterium]